jgi:S1-C subfamily serine protease
MGVLDEIQDAVARVAERTAPSVVGIGNGWARGSGVVLGDSTVLTNAHNVHGTEATVSFADGRSATGQVTGLDADGDLAVISVDTGGAPAIAWGSGEVVSGSAVFAAANPGGRGLRVTFGLVSGTSRDFRGPRGRRIAGSIEHTAPMGRGSSGSPIVDAEGRFLGINTNRLGDGFYLAIPADDALRGRADALSRGESPSRPRLGIAIAPAHVARRLRRAVGLPERDGLLVRHVEDDSPAARAGVAQGDLIVEAGGRVVGSVDDLWEALDAVADGASLEMKVVRGSEDRTIAVGLGATRTTGEA